MRYHDVKLKALVRLVAIDAAIVLLAVLAIVFPEQSSALLHALRPRAALNPIETAAFLFGFAFLVLVIGVWLAALTPHQEVQMLRRRQAKGKPVGSPHPSIFDESDPDHHLSTFGYLRKKWRG